MFSTQNQNHRKTASNSKSNETQKKSGNQYQSRYPNNQILQQLSCLKMLKKLLLGTSKSLNKNNSKTRIFTEGNENQLKVHTSASPTKNNPYGQSASPPQRNMSSQAKVISNLLNTNMNHAQYKRQSRNQRNQSADFQQLQAQQQSRQDRLLKNNGKKKFNSYGNLNDQVYFAQKGGLIECSSTVQLVNNPDQKLKNSKGSFSLKNFPTPINICAQQITLQEFKEKLNELRKDIRQNNAFEELQKTQKKQQYDYHKYDHQESEKLFKQEITQRSKSVDSQSSRSRLDILRYSKDCINQNKIYKQQNVKEEEFIINTQSYLTQKKLESKIDQLVFQVQILKKKSEELELQNRFLFENLTKFQKESDYSAEERNLLMNKLDQMIGMQRRQEENLNFFKQIFVKGYDQSRRIKTEQQQQQQEEDNLQLNQKTEILSKQRPFVKSAYQGLEFNV
ncbi:unnamed protein product (macronuclear) [Paramecium tetraurelia]|uniref:Uncharacterized protein n=1 Tax=Paramecium tetraurelia TaxID=5888 RepID=A0C9D5_PARTE|nr:uncharacterized protein GSPATT00006708001 [Paramecium tetraurelia]CAK67402.1 unnamed protein product [Paramecium tetraurelia]|eukprot:XP_001434799.1 hypothetical protein (macronuclear) [Paramecium tetraurelia strain d4-2]